jgi:hypothetical protein
MTSRRFRRSGLSSSRLQVEQGYEATFVAAAAVWRGKDGSRSMGQIAMGLRSSWPLQRAVLLLLLRNVASCSGLRRHSSRRDDWCIGRRRCCSWERRQVAMVLHTTAVDHHTASSIQVLSSGVSCICM